MSDNSNPAAIAAALAAPFAAAEVKFKPQTVSGNRALAVPFVDARVIQDRLDEVLGVMGWQDCYECLPDGSVVCRLSVRLETEWITKMDVGSPSEQRDEGDRRKAAFSDALKRAAVKFGIGRYLYRSKPQWCDYDPAKRQFTQRPQLPAAVATAPTRKTVNEANGQVKLHEPAAATPKPPAVQKAAAELVSRQQVEDIEWLCKSRGKNVAAMCRRFDVTSLEQLTPADYEKAAAGLKALPAGPAVRAAAPAAS